MKEAEVAMPGPMRHSVCLLTNAYPDFPDSNRVVFLRNLAQLLVRKGCMVTVVAPRIFAASRPLETEGGIEIHRFASFMGNRLLVEYSHTPVFRLIGYMAAGLLFAIRFVRTRKCDIIHAHWVIPAGLIALMTGWFCGKPVVVTAHGSDILLVSQRNPVMKWFSRFVLKHADAITSVAKHLTDGIVAMGIPPEKILTFPMSVATEAFADHGPSHQSWIGEQVIFSNRSLYPVYDVETLVKAVPSILEKFPHARIVIAGEGPESDRIATIAKESSGREQVQFLGSIPHERMPEYLRAASVYVSTALSDGASVSLLEAMACGTFPVVADIPANREWIKDGENGFLFAPGDAKALARKIEDCLGQPVLRERARETNARIIQQRAQWNLNVEKLLALYEKAMIR